MAALLDASLEGDVRHVSTLVLQGVDLNQRTADGWSALIYAAKEGHLEVVQLLLRGRADLDKSLRAVSES